MSELRARREEMSRVFHERYAAEPEGWVRAPGRAELLGTDTDDHLGYVMTMAIPADTWIACRPSGSSRVGVYSMNLGEEADYRLGEEPEERSSRWERYVSGVSQILRTRGYRPGGVEAVIHGTVPIGGGLSSSASLEVAACLMFQAAGGFVLDPRQTAEVCQQAENQCVGVMCGILDQYSSCFGKEGTALFLDCRSLTHIEVGLPPDIRVVVCDTNFPRTLAGSEYAKRRAECDEGTRLLRDASSGIRTLRDVSSRLFARLEAGLPETNRRRCRFIVEENQRVVDFFGAVVRDDRAAMRKLCAGSFAGMRDLYEKTVPAMESMYEAMVGAPGAIAARQSGGGFGGCMVAYVEADRVDAFSARVRADYKRLSGLDATVIVTRPSAGAGRLEL
jgi:galactokinase